MDWRSKRQDEVSPGDGFLRTLPPVGSLLDVSRAYDRGLARELDARRARLLGYGESPDWAPVLGSPEEVL